MKKWMALLLGMVLMLGVFAHADDFDESFEDYAFEEAETTIVASFEEAAGIFASTVPAYIAPEGFALQEIIVEEFSLTAVYASADAGFEFTVYEFGAVDGLAHCSMEGGKLVPASGSIVDVYEENGFVTSADYYTPQGAAYFFFENMDMAAAEAALNGLQLG